MRGRKDGEGKRDREMNGAPFAHEASSQTVPEQLMLDLYVGEARTAKIGLRLFHPALRTLHEILTCQTTCNGHSHCGDS